MLPIDLFEIFACNIQKYFSDVVFLRSYCTEGKTLVCFADAAIFREICSFGLNRSCICSCFLVKCFQVSDGFYQTLLAEC